MSPVVDATSETSRGEAVSAAVDAVRRGEVVVIPTDTVYGVGCDAFSPEAVRAVLEAKGRGREKPPPVLVPDQRTLDGLARNIPPWVRDLVEQYWPGPLTVVLDAQRSLHWDLGDTDGTVALRMPDDEVALEVLRETGPMAVTSANQTGQTPARTVLDAATQLGSAVTVYLDAGPRSEGFPSTIVDCTGETPTILREGVITEAQVLSVFDEGSTEPAGTSAPAHPSSQIPGEPQTNGNPPPSQIPGEPQTNGNSPPSPDDPTAPTHDSEDDR